MAESAEFRLPPSITRDQFRANDPGSSIWFYGQGQPFQLTLRTLFSILQVDRVLPGMRKTMAIMLIITMLYKIPKLFIMAILPLMLTYWPQ
jgi:hypothetical protein